MYEKQRSYSELYGIKCFYSYIVKRTYIKLAKKNFIKPSWLSNQVYEYIIYY